MTYYFYRGMHYIFRGTYRPGGFFRRTPDPAFTVVQSPRDVYAYSFIYNGNYRDRSSSIAFSFLQEPDRDSDIIGYLYRGIYEPKGFFFKSPPQPAYTIVHGKSIDALVYEGTYRDSFFSSTPVPAFSIVQDPSHSYDIDAYIYKGTYFGASLFRSAPEPLFTIVQIPQSRT